MYVGLGTVVSWHSAHNRSAPRQVLVRLWKHRHCISMPLEQHYIQLSPPLPTIHKQTGRQTPLSSEVVHPGFKLTRLQRCDCLNAG
jgi:hypothetical protein